MKSLHSVPERAFSGTECACGAKKGLLVYATRFQRHSVQKTGLWCTEWKFGAKKGLLVYAMHFHEALGAQNRLLGYRMKSRMRGSYTVISNFAKTGHLLRPPASFLPSARGSLH